MDHYYYGQQSRSRSKKLPRSLLEQTPEDMVAPKKRLAKATVGATPKRSRTRLDIMTTPTTGHKDVDSEDDLEAVALANTVISETAMSDMCGGGTWRTACSTRSAFASLSNIPVSLHGQSVNLLANTHNIDSG
jgi:hypothetical protein